VLTASEVGLPPDDLLLDDELASILGRTRDHDDPLPTIVRGALATVEPIVQSRQATIALALDEALAHRIAPHDLVHPALVQLLLAALDWRPPGALTVAATIDADEVVLAVAVEARAPRAPGPDERDALDRRVGVARRLLAPMGGQVSCRLGLGLQIDLRLPAALAPTILVVEDNPQVVQLFRRYFSGSPFQMTWAPNGTVAFDLATATPPAAITLDLLLPERDGWEFLQLARVHPATRHIPVVVCSVLRERELALALGAADFLPKPVTQSALLGSLRRLVRRPAPSNAPASAQPR
jgi:CheY-like chemotaxis protein